MTETTARAADQLVNGVFQGGGAKSVAYAGALQAVRDRNLWFGSVAGTSAGAITGSLIAAGYLPHELDAEIPKLLSAANAPLAPRLGKAVLGMTTSVLEGDGLRRQLDALYAHKMNEAGTPADGPVTFEQLHGLTGIELYVVTLDLAEGLPMVFSRRTTPHVEVAGAVVASSAIPFVFPAGRAVFDIGGSRSRVHQLVDGMMWANYPSFVFDDSAFRAFLRGECELEGAWSDGDDAAWDAEQARPVLGFVFGEAEPLEHRNSIGFVPVDGPSIDRRFDLGPAATSRGRVHYAIGSLLSSDWARLAIAVALAIWISLSVVTLPIAFRRFSTWMAGWMPDPLYPVALVGSLTVVVMALVVLILVTGFVMAISRLVADTLLPVLDAVIGIPREVPPWVGFGSDSVVLRVPREGLKSTKFDLDAETRALAVENARVGVDAQLAGASGERLAALLAGEEPDPPVYRRGERPLAADDESPTSPFVIGAVVLAVTVVVGGLTWWATNSAATEGIWIIVLAVAGAVAATTIAFRYVADRTRRRASRRATLGTDHRQWYPPWAIAAVGAAFVVGGVVLSAVAMDQRADDTVRAEVVIAIGGSDLNEYGVAPVEGPSAPALPVTSERHLRLGEQVFVTIGDDGAAELAGALDDVRFGVAIVLLVLGGGAITSAERTRRWNVRRRRLDEITTNWQQREVPA